MTIYYTIFCYNKIYILSYIYLFLFIIFLFYYIIYILYKKSTTVAGFEPTHPEDN